MPHTSFTLRLIVGQPDGPRSAIWRLWTNKSDVYLSSRNLARSFKISLHDGGRCIAAFTSELADALGGEAQLHGGSRRMDAWTRQSHVATGVEIPCRVLFPTSELTLRPFDQTVSDLIWIPPAPPGHAVSLAAAFASHPLDSNHWPGKARGTVQLAAAALPNGESVWIVAMRHALSPAVVAEVARAKATLNNEPVWQTPDFEAGGQDLRAVICADEENGRRVYVDADLDRLQ